MKILVIDDNRANLESAKMTLEGHELTLCQTVVEAYQQLKSNTFDAVLTDLHMPLGEFNGLMTPGSRKPDGTLPVGLVFAIKAANQGTRVVICTDSDHHQDWFCSMLDLLGDAYAGKIDCAQRISYVEARTCPVKGYWDETTHELVVDEKSEWWKKPLVKNWRTAMLVSRLFPELSTQS